MTATRKRLILFCALLGAAGSATAQQVEIVPVRGNIYLLGGAGGNITASVGPDGVLLVDSGLAQMSDKVLAAIRQLSQVLTTKGLPNTTTPPPKPIRYIINTHMHADHTGGNEAIGKAGVTITGGNVAGEFRDATEGAAIIAHENVLRRMSEAKGPFRAFPTDTYLRGEMKLSHFFNGEAVEILHQASAHTDGDSMVYFRYSDVIAAGDILSTESYPVIDLEKGGTIQGVLDGLNHILDLAIPEFRSQGGTWVVPGHGRLCDIGDVANYRNMVAIVRDRIQDMIQRGMTLDQVKAAKPTMDYDGLYGSNDKFIEAAYRSLKRP
jgi:cyclase